MSESDSVARHRLIALLEAIQRPLEQFLDTCNCLRGPTAVPGSFPLDFKLPYCVTSENDVKAAAQYLPRFGIGEESGRIKAEYADLRKCLMRVWIAEKTWINPPRGQALQQEFSFFVPAVENATDYQKQRDAFLLATLGAAGRMNDTVKGLLQSIRGASGPAAELETPPIVVVPVSPTLEEKVNPDENRRSREQPAAVSAGDITGEVPSRADVFRQLRPCVRKAYLSFELAQSKAGSELEDRAAFDWLKENGFPDDAGDTGELVDYELPDFDTWTRYLREAREALGEQKYSRRAGRKGKSVAGHDEL
jgi:hypothetical protein